MLQQIARQHLYRKVIWGTSRAPAEGFVLAQVFGMAAALGLLGSCSPAAGRDASSCRKAM